MKPNPAPTREPAVHWVPIDQCIGHPLNSNRMSEAMMAKLARHIEASGRYPPLIVRSLGRSQSPPAADAATLQVIDGHHRLEVLRRLGRRRVRVDCWGDLSDGETELLLATLNRLEGRDDAERRAALLERLRADAQMDESALAALLPETAESLAALAALRFPPPLDAPPPPLLVPLTVFLTPAQHEQVRRALEAAMKAAPGMTEADALVALCGAAETAANETAASRTPSE